MFKINYIEDKCNSLNCVELVNSKEKSKTYIKIAINTGASLQELYINNTPIIKENGDLHYASSILFPFVNRINKGIYNFNGTSYKLKINAEKEGNAIHEVAWDQFILQKGNINNNNRKEGNTLEISKNGNVYEIKNNLVSLTINATSGELNSWSFEGIEITNQPIRPNFWRPPTDNDLGNGMDKWAKIWQDATYNYTSVLVSPPEISGKNVVFKTSYTTPNKEAVVDVVFKLKSSGEIEVDYTFKPTKKELPNIPRIGMVGYEMFGMPQRDITAENAAKIINEFIL